MRKSIQGTVPGTVLVACGLLALSATLLLPSCTPDCPGGQSIACAGPGGCAGYQVCEGGMAWGACICEPQDGGTVVDAGSDADAGSEVDAGAQPDAGGNADAGSVPDAGTADAGSPCGAGCDDANPCTADICSLTGCVHVNTSDACDDGNPCTAGDACSAGACAGMAAATCDDQNPCTVDSCSAAGCASVPHPDGASCGEGLLCRSGQCVPGCKVAGQLYDAGAPSPASPCLSCQPSASTSVFLPVTDGASCGNGQACHAGVCGPCLAGAPCTPVGSCRAGALRCDTGLPTCEDVGPATNGTACDDGNACTRTDACQSGACVGGDAVTCTALDACHDVGTCDPATGSCSQPAGTDGRACDDADACTR